MSELFVPSPVDGNVFQMKRMTVEGQLTCGQNTKFRKTELVIPLFAVSEQRVLL